MITGELRNKIDKIWETFWTGGITNPLDVIEQFTYLLFIKQLDEVETTKENEANFLGVDYESMFPGECQKYRWSKFKNLGSAEEMYELVLNGVFPFIKNLHQDGDSAYARYMGDAIFKIPTAAMLSKIVDGIDKLELGDEESKGDLYEYLLSKVATAGTNGQFRTPRHIIKMMVELVKPAPDDTIIDPAMGSAGFLIEAQSYLRENHPELFLHQESLQHFNNTMFYGNDMDRTMLRIGAMNMLLHGVENPNISYRDSLSEQNTDVEKYSLVLANPPFKGSLDYEAVSADLLKVTKTKKTELLFLALFLRILKKGGRAAVIVPDGVLFDAQGYRGLLFDIDNTLVPHGAPADERACALFAHLKELGFKCCFLSNNQYERVSSFNDAIGAQFIENAHKPSTKNYIRAMELLGTDRSNTVFIGDQLFTDIYGAKRTGIRNILVKPLNPKEEIQIVLKRYLERIVLYFYRKEEGNS